MPALTTATTPLPRPSRVHATCAWCRTDFVTIIDLIDHVDRGHTPIVGAPPAGLRPSRRAVAR